jgi:hypothetical protein
MIADVVFYGLYMCFGWKLVLRKVATVMCVCRVLRHAGCACL